MTMTWSKVWNWTNCDEAYCLVCKRPHPRTARTHAFCRVLIKMRLRLDYVSSLIIVSEPARSIIRIVKISSYTDIIFTLWVPFPKSNFFITHSTLFFSSSRTFSNHFWHSATFINKFCLCVSTFLFETCICCYRAQPLPCISNLDNGKTSLQLGGCFLFQDHLNFFI